MTERKPNRLINEKSPYLLQHAHNPVDWFAWGEEAFERARREDKPVLLSIGYSTCHWCHVMEHESFENDQIAQLMNENFVSIKVDREERPDLDQIYMTAVSAITGQGGWPLNIFLTPEKKPFYGGTYFPSTSRWGHPGFTEVLTAVSHSWKNDRERVLSAGTELTELLRQNFSKTVEGRPVDEVTLGAAFHELQAQFDGVYGGFGQAPKFPMGHNLSFLLRYWKRTGHKDALSIVEKTLLMMARGGMYDQLGGGFHRYSTDAVWHVPHFEKMLYDQALLVRCYLEAYQATKDPFFKKIADETLEYVLRDLRDPAGAFYSAEDADSAEPGGTHKKEGAFYVWTHAEIKKILGEKEAAVVSFYFGAEETGNVGTDPHQEFTGKNILLAAHSLDETARQFGQTVSEIEETLGLAQEKLLEARKFRPRPHLDDKILVDWNGLMISAFACAASVLENDQYQKAAREAADFILEKMITRDGRLLHRFRQGEAAIVGTLEDYAFFILGLLDLYESTCELKYFTRARQLADHMLDLFADERGGFFLTGKDAEELIARPKEVYDGALPSGNSVAALILLRLYHLTSQDIYRKKAEEIFKAFGGQISQRPSAFAFCLSALDFALGPVHEIVLAGLAATPEATAMRQAVYKNFQPNKIVVQLTGREPAGFSDEIPLVKGRMLPARGTAAYVCQDQTCRPPVHTEQELEALFVNVQKV
jgi:uncharacterized protein YyaL (SSP411 family)